MMVAPSMATRLTRSQLHDLVWSRPIIHLAAEYGLSDVGLRKACHRHDIPTPPAGWWAKKAHGKASPALPLPATRPADELVSLQGYASEGGELAAARAATRARLEAAAEGEAATDPVAERTISRLEKAKAGRDGVKRVAGPGLVSVAVRPSSEGRAGKLLRALVAAASGAGIRLGKTAEGAVFHCDGETVGLELAEARDQVEHVATEKELAAVAKWKREREERHRRFGYWSDYGEPHIPKWEEQYNGRLTIRLEKVRAQSEDDYWGRVVTRTFADSRTRDVMKMVPRMVEAVAAIAAAKKSNRAIGERRRLAAEERERQWQEQEHRRRIEDQRGKALDQLLSEREATDRLAAFAGKLRVHAGDDPPGRVKRLLEWAEKRLAGQEEQLSPAVLEERLAQGGLFGEDDRQGP